MVILFNFAYLFIDKLIISSYFFFLLYICLVNFHHSLIISKKSIIKKLILAFSWNQNYRLMFITHNNKNYDNNNSSRNCKDIDVISGIRVLCVLWIIFIHSCTILYYFAGNF